MNNMFSLSVRISGFFPATNNGFSIVSKIINPQSKELTICHLLRITYMITPLSRSIASLARASRTHVRRSVEEFLYYT